MEKRKIFERMQEYGWHLYDDTFEDFENVYNIHCTTIKGIYDYFIRQEENNKVINLNDLNKVDIQQMAEFMSDFLRALNALED